MTQKELETAWYASHGVTHAHCPEGCPKPQPFLAEDGKMYCGRCAAYLDKLVEVVPCTPEVCD